MNVKINLLVAGLESTKTAYYDEIKRELGCAFDHIFNRVPELMSIGWNQTETEDGYCHVEYNREFILLNGRQMPSYTRWTARGPVEVEFNEETMIFPQNKWVEITSAVECDLGIISHDMLRELYGMNTIVTVNRDNTIRLRRLD